MNMIYKGDTNGFPVQSARYICQDILKEAVIFSLVINSPVFLYTVLYGLKEIFHLLLHLPVKAI